jgi:subtilisin family serine protease
LVALTAAVVVPNHSAAHPTVRLGPSTEYVVVYADAHHPRAARAAIAAAGGRMLSENRDVGTALVRTDNSDFTTTVRRGGAVLGAAHNRAIGHLPSLRSARELVERLSPADRAEALRRTGVGVGRPTIKQAAIKRAAIKQPGINRVRPAGDGDGAAALRPAPLADLQWDMAMIDATVTGSYATDQGDRRVKVGVIDTGIDGHHPSIAANFDAADSRNFVTDIPSTDGPCPEPTCKDPIDVDNNGHGTHVASTIAAPLNGIGIAGVAPNVQVVNIRAGQNSGFFFLQPVVDALTYAADAGMNVVNMSFYVDPWLYNCTNNPKDSAAARNEQHAVVAAMTRAVNYARGHNVTLIAALGNESADLDHVNDDPKSPDFPVGTAYDRKIDSNCLSVPTELDGVISVTAVGPSGRKAYYSDYSLKYARFSAPGGDAFDTSDAHVDPTAQILAAYPEKVGRAVGDIDANGNPTTPFVVKDCHDGVCAYYQYLQGTSMAAPHAAGVAALAVSRFGTPAGDSLVLDPRLTELAIALGADRHGCPQPRSYRYVLKQAEGTKTFAHVCDERLDTNSFYGRGVTSAGGVVLLPKLTPPVAEQPHTANPSPTTAPSASPTTAPSATPTGAPSAAPSAAPSTDPNTAPSTDPSTAPAADPTPDPSGAPADSAGTGSPAASSAEPPSTPPPTGTPRVKRPG